MYLLDTNVVSSLRRPEKAPEPLLRWFNAATPAQLFISCVTVFELDLGVVQKERRDVVQGRVLRFWLENQVLPQFQGRVLNIDATIARRCAAMHSPDPAPERDAWIAATALVHGMTVVSRNVVDFVRCGASVLDPWQTPA